jgi:hypothetical protein
MHIAGRRERLKGSDVSMDLKTPMEWRSYDRVFVDIVIPNNGELEDQEGGFLVTFADIGLATFLAVFTPSAPLKEAKQLPAPLATKPEQAESNPAACRARILEELQSTERHFLAWMQHLLQDYHAPLKARAKSTDPLLNMYQVNTIFP